MDTTLDSRTHYTVLGLRPNSTDNEIRDRYLALAKVAHPDHGGDHERFTAISQAYRAIRTEELRRKYNERLRLLGIVCSECMGSGTQLKRRGFTQATTVNCSVCGGTGVG